MKTEPCPTTGLIESLRNFAESCLAAGQARVELVAVELHEEKLRLMQSFIWICAAVFAAGLTLVFGSLTVVYLCGEEGRLAALGGLTLIYAAVLVALTFTFRRFLARQPLPFAATREELSKDRACIHNEN
jgi:uncharacterized membrane protein YqjE